MHDSIELARKWKVLSNYHSDEISESDMEKVQEEKCKKKYSPITK
jgi:hypothetical protein